MFTPQRKQWSPLTPRSDAHRVGFSNPRSAVGGKGKEVMVVDDPPQLPPPPVSFLNERGPIEVMDDEDNVDDWMRFKEAGFLDEAALERRDREALVERLSKLEQALFDYQHNMGLLLIEKKEWTLKFEGLHEELAEAQEIFKRAQTAHRIALSEGEKRVDKLVKALDNEKKGVLDLEKALRDVLEEQGTVKLSSELKLANANSLVDGIKEKSIGVEKNLCAAEAKLAEVNSKYTVMDMKLQELETRESVLQRERLSFVAEQEKHKAAFYRQREELIEWERKLRVGEERLSDLRRTLNQRGEKANDKDIIMKQKERSVEEMQQKINVSNLKMKEREGSVNKRLADLVTRENEAGNMKSILAEKEKKLLDLEEKLAARERMEIQSIIDEQRVSLDTKMQEFDLELEEKRKSLDKELRSKIDEVEKRGLEVNHREEKIRKREEALQMKLEKVKENEKGLEAKLKAVKDKEKLLKKDEKKQHLEKQHLLKEKENLLIIKGEIDQMKTEISQQELQIVEEREKLKLSEEERSEHFRLQSELKQQIDNCRYQGELLLKDYENLKQERQNFEIEWEVLDKKRDEINELQEKLGEEKVKFEKLQLLEEERLRKEESAMQNYKEEQLKAITMQKESFESTMKHEKSILSEQAQNEHNKMLQEFEHRKLEMETDLRCRFDEMQKNLEGRMRAFEEEKERDLNNIRRSKEEAARQMEESRSEWCAFEREKQEVAVEKNKLKDQQLEMSKDINELNIISGRFKDRRQFVHERNQFLAFVEKLKNCNDCGELMREFVLSDFHLLDSVDEQVPSVSQIAGKPLIKHHGNAGVSGIDIKGSSGKMSLLRKCTSKNPSISPTKRNEGKDQLPGLVVSKEAGESSAHADELQPRLGILSESLQGQRPQSESRKEVDDVFSQSLDEQSFLNSKEQEDPENSQQSELESVRQKPGRRRKSGLKRTSTMQAAIKESKEILGESFEEPEPSQSMQSHEEDAGTSSHVKKRTRSYASKRARESELDAADSKECHDTVTVRGREKRLRAVAPVHQTHYNLRRHKTSETATQVVQASSDLKTRDEALSDLQTRDEATSDVKTIEETREEEERNGCSILEEGDDFDAEHLGEVSMGKKIWTFFTT